MIIGILVGFIAFITVMKPPFYYNAFNGDL